MEMATLAARKQQSEVGSKLLPLRDASRVEQILKDNCRKALQLSKLLDTIDELRQRGDDDEAWLMKAWVDVFSMDAAVEVAEKEFMRAVTRMGLKFHQDKLGPMIAETPLADAQKESLTKLYGRLQALARDVCSATYAVKEMPPPSAPSDVEAKLEKKHDGQLMLVVSCAPLTSQEKHLELELLLQVEGMFEDDEPVIVEMLEEHDRMVARLTESDLYWLFASEIAFSASYKCELYKRDSFNSIDGDAVPLLVQDLDYAMNDRGEDKSEDKSEEEMIPLEEARKRLQRLVIDLDENFADERPRPTSKGDVKKKEVPKPSSKPQPQHKPCPDRTLHTQTSKRCLEAPHATEASPFGRRQHVGSQHSSFKQAWQRLGSASSSYQQALSQWPQRTHASQQAQIPGAQATGVEDKAGQVDCEPGKRTGRLARRLARQLGRTRLAKRL